MSQAIKKHLPAGNTDRCNKKDIYRQHSTKNMECQVDRISGILLGALTLLAALLLAALCMAELLG